MTSLAHTRCYHHPEREAVARCPQCHRTFCRECISDHDGKALCSDCLVENQLSPPRPIARWRQGLQRLAGATLGLTLCWFLFHLLAALLLKLPNEFHEGQWLP